MALGVAHLGGQTTTVGGGGTITSDSWTSTSGSLIVVVVHVFGTSGVAANGDVTDSKSNSYTLAKNVFGGVAPGVGVYYNNAGTRGASHTVSSNLVNSSTNDSNLSVIEITGQDPTSPFDSTTAATATDATSPLTVTAAAAISGTQIAIGGCVIDTSGTNAWGAPGGYSNINNQANGSTSLVGTADYKIGETGTPAIEWTNADTIGGGAQVFVTFKEDASGGVSVGNAPVTVAANNPTITRTDPYVVSSIGAAITASASPSVTFSGYTPLENDVIAFFMSSTSAVAVVANASLPSGWVNPLGDGVEVNADTCGMGVIYHKVTSTEQTNVTLTYTATSSITSTTGYVQAVAVRNVDPANVVDGFNTAFDSSNTVTPHVLAGITGSGVLLADGLVVSSVTKDSTGAYSSVPGGWTQVRADNTNQGRWIGYRDAQTVLNTDVTATNITPSAGDEYASITLAFARLVSGANVTVGNAAVTATANNSSSAVAPTTGSAAVTVTANQVTISRRVDVGVAAVSATANSSGAAVAHAVGNAAVTSTGNSSGAAVASTIGTSVVTVTGNNATVSTTTNVNVDVGSAAVTVTANNASHTIASAIGTSSVTSTANSVTAAPSPSAGSAAVTVTGFAPSHDIRPGSGYAPVVIAANNVTIPSVAFYVTSVSGNGHYLLDQNADPYFVSGNSPQNMVPHAPLSEMASFFADQQARGFNSAQVHLIYNFEADAESSTAPFGVDGNLAPQNSGYWATIDSMFDLAETYGFTLWATVIDNISCGATVESSVSTAEAFAYGQFLGARYASRPGLVWVIGNDFDSSQWTARNPKYQNILAGIRDQGDTHLATVWNNTQPANANTSWDTLYDIDNGYEYDTPPYEQIGVSYALTRTGFPKPVVWFEGTYYNEHNANPAGTSTDLELRKLAWWTITWGGVGHFFGTEEVWNFDDWTSELTANIYDHLQLIPGFMTGLTDWELMIPDTGNVFLTGGHSTATGSLDTSTYATAAYVASGVTGLIYFPTSRGSITIDTTKLSGTVTGYWWDPTDGSTSVESTPAAPTHPGNNTGGDGDWVLVLQGSAAVNVTVGNAPVTVTGNNASHAIAVSVGVAAVTATANNSSSSVKPTTGNAAVTATGNDSGSAVAHAVGTSVVTVTANNATVSTSAQTNVSVGVATVTATANNPGGSAAHAVEVATVAVTGNQITAAPALTVGSAAVSATANNSGAAVAASVLVALVIVAGNQAAVDNGEGVATLIGMIRTRRPDLIRTNRPGLIRTERPEVT